MSRLDQIRQLAEQGCNAAEIALFLGLDKHRVSQVIRLGFKWPRRRPALAGCTTLIAMVRW